MTTYDIDPDVDYPSDDWGTWPQLFRGGSMDGQVFQNPSPCMAPWETHALPDGRVEIYVYQWAEAPNGPKRLYEPDEDGMSVYRFLCYDDQVDWNPPRGMGVYDGKML